MVKSAFQYVLVSLSFLFCLSLWAQAEPSTSGTLSVGEALQYRRGTARAKEEVLEFPYYHRARPNQECWAYVVRKDRGARLICKAAEAQGEKDESGQLANQDFKADHPFMKTLDLIKQDAYANLRKELQGQKPLKEDGWKTFDDGSAVHKIFYRDSKRRIYCFLGVKKPGSKSLQGPMPVSFFRTERGPMMSAQSAGGTWSPPQPVDAIRTNSAYKVFTYLEKRQGF